jgi:glycerol-3-phosphate dehydrogenase
MNIDIVIFGGGVAGLWLLNQLQKAGYSVVLLETNALGAGQTICSQGIIHGGMKYALQGKITAAARALQDIPTIWKQCLAGSGAIDLSRVPILSKHQYLWSTQTLRSKIAGFLASVTLQNATAALSAKDYPSLFQHPDFKGEMYALDEYVIDVPQLLLALSAPFRSKLIKIKPLQSDALEIDANNKVKTLTLQTEQGTLILNPRLMICTAGKGNEFFIKNLQIKNVKMQCRPLHMVAVKHKFPHQIFAHCVGLNNIPRLTITTHAGNTSEYIWYLGGQLAEEGVTKTPAAQITAARKELAHQFPWLDFKTAEFTSFYIERAENAELLGKKPASPFLKQVGNTLIAWPTKLAFAPALSTKIITHLTKQEFLPQFPDPLLPNFTPPDCAIPFWQSL